MVSELNCRLSQSNVSNDISAALPHSGLLAACRRTVADWRGLL